MWACTKVETGAKEDKEVQGELCRESCAGSRRPLSVRALWEGQEGEGLGWVQHRFGLRD